MIIVSQDKTEIVNFENIESIWICPDEEGRFTIEATANVNSTLGYYKIKERAKEVLKEIVNTYAMIGIDIETYAGGTQRQLPIYEMPEE